MKDMNPTRRKDVLRLLKTTRNRFVSLTAIVLIGTAFFTGVAGSSTMLSENADAYNDSYQLKDITIYSSYGFNESDIEAVNALESVEKAEGTKFVDVIAQTGTSSQIARVHAYDPEQTINQFVLKEGRLPENDHEILAERGTGMMDTSLIGAEVIFRRPDDDLEDYLVSDTYTVTGLIDTPLYLNLIKDNSTLGNRTISTYFYVPESAFSLDIDTEINVLIKDGASYNSYTEEYEEYASEVKKEIEELSLTQSEQRRNEIVEEAQEQYDAGLQEYNEGLQEYQEKIIEAEEKLKEAQEEIEAGRTEIKQNREKLLAAQNTLDAQKESADSALHAYQSEIDQGYTKLAQARQELAQAEEQKSQIETGMEQLTEAYESLLQAEEGLEQIDQGMNEIDTSVAQLSEAQEKLSALPLSSEDTLSSLRDLDPDTYDLIQQAGIPEDMTLGEVKAVLQAGNAILAEGMQILEEIPEDTALPSYILHLDHDQIQEVLNDTSLNEEQKEKILALADTYDQTDLVQDVLQGINTLTGTEITSFRDMKEMLYQLGDITAGYENTLDILMDQEASAADYETLPEFAPLIGTLKEAGKITDEAGLEEIRTAVTELIDELGSTRTQLEDQKNEILQVLADQGIDSENIDDALKELNAQYAQLSELKEQVTAGMEEGSLRLAESEETLRNAQELLKQRKSAYLQTIQNAQAQIDTGRQELAEAESEISEGEETWQASYELYEKEKEDGLAKLNEAEEKLHKAEQDIQSLAENSWIVVDRTSHYASVSFGMTVDQMQAIADIFPVFFLFVAALVCLSTMMRMVNEHRGEIGCMRALGYTNFQCMQKYLIYASLAGVIGVVLGSIAGLFTFPYAIYNAWKMLYVLPDMRIYVNRKVILFAALAFLLVLDGTVFLVCRNEMKENPAQLLRPKTGKPAKQMRIERTAFFHKLSFTQKVSIRNLVRYKQRLIMTLAGVAGCTALLVMGFGIKDSLNDMVDLQFGEIMHYSGTASLQEGVLPSQVQETLDQIKELDTVEDAVSVSSYRTVIDTGTGSASAGMLIFDNEEERESFLTLRTRIGHKDIALETDGIVITERLAENLDLKKGDTVQLESSGGVVKEAVIADICEMYINHYVFCSREYYEQLFGTSPAENSILIQETETDENLQNMIADMEMVESVDFMDSVLSNFRTMIRSLDLIVWVILAASMALAFVVLGNLTNINIAERQREIATLKVLGFRKREVQEYVFRESTVLTFIGSLLGIPAGIVLHRIIMGDIELEYVIFGRSVHMASILAGIVITAFFGWIVNRFMRGKLDRIDMLESLKSVE